MSRIKVCDLSAHFSLMWCPIFNFFFVLIGHILKLLKCPTCYFHDFTYIWIMSGACIEFFSIHITHPSMNTCYLGGWGTTKMRRCYTRGWRLISIDGVIHSWKTTWHYFKSTFPILWWGCIRVWVQESRGSKHLLHGIYCWTRDCTQAWRSISQTSM